MGAKVEKSESRFKVTAVVVEARKTIIADSYDGTASIRQEEIIEHVNLTVTAENKDDAIVKAIRHLNNELSTDDEPTQDDLEAMKARLQG